MLYSWSFSLRSNVNDRSHSVFFKQLRDTESSAAGISDPISDSEPVLKKEKNCLTGKGELLPQSRLKYLLISSKNRGEATP